MYQMGNVSNVLMSFFKTFKFLKNNIKNLEP